MRTVAFSAVFLATGLVPALAADPTGDWRVADGVANIRVAECNGNMWGAVAWEKTPGGRDNEQSRCLETEQADPGNADPDRHEEEACRRSMGRPSLQRQGRPDVRDDDQAGRHRSDGDSRLRAGLPMRRRNLDPRLRARSPQAPPTAWPRARRRARERFPRRPRSSQRPRATDHSACAEDHRRRQPGCPNPVRSRRPASPATSAISAYSPTSRGLPISAGWNSSTAASVVTSESASSLPMLAVPG